MTYDTAYSLEDKQVYTALEANEKGRKNLLKDARRFQCSEYCEFPLTCVNFKKSKGQRKREPYFREGNSTSIHSCELKDTKNLSNPNKSESKETKKEVEKNNSNIKLKIDISSGFSLPTTQKSNISNSSKGTNSSQSTYTKNANENKSIKNETPNISSLSRLVATYHSSEYDNKNTILTLESGEEISLHDIFHNIDKKTLLEDFTHRVFFGEGKLVEKEDYYILRFNTFCKMEGLKSKSKPSVLLFKKYLKNHPRLQKRVHNIAQTNDKFMLYFFGEIIISGENSEYLQFYVNTNNENYLANLYIK